MKSFALGELTVGGPDLVVVAGPCMAESKEVCREVASALKDICAEFGFGYVFKASFDKANRTSVRSERGAGLEGGLALLRAGTSEDIPT